MNISQLSKAKRKFVTENVTYKMCYYKDYNYEILKNGMYYRKRGPGKHPSVSDAWIMLDTETSKKPSGEYNHVVAFTISIRMFSHNIVTLYGNKPSEAIECMTMVHKYLPGTRTYFYVHNLGYDYVFLRLFMFKAWGVPKKQLALKSHQPIEIIFDNGIVLKDSLILAQRKLEKWAKDMCAEHQKAVGSWDYDLIRNQDHKFTPDEMRYIEQDTLAGVECLDTLALQLKKHVCDMPYTATGIPREDVLKIGSAEYAKQLFNKIVLSYDQYIKATMVFHGGYTHANRYASGIVHRCKGESFDFSSSYPYVMLSEKYPMDKFTPLDDQTIDYILKYRDDHAFMFKLILVKPYIKDNIPMPALQSSKCVEKLNPIIDNGRILAADYIAIYTNEIDLSVIALQYDYEYAICKEVEYCRKDYLPRWFTDYIYSLYTDKCVLKGGDDPVLYALQKAKLNSCYGMCVMRNIREPILENYETGEYYYDHQKSEDIYEQFIKNWKNILPYQWGVWVTSYAFRNLHLLGAAISPEGTWLYSDTDSCYGYGWNYKNIEFYNEICKQKLRDNGYGPVVVNGREFWLGIAEHDSDFTEFITQGAKRYCKRVEDGLSITVAGVPKSGYKCLRDDINNFQPGLIFDGKTTGKLTHRYFYVNDIYIDKWGNETGDSIDLSLCDYLLGFDGAKEFIDIEDLFNIDQYIKVYEE